MSTFFWESEGWETGDPHLQKIKSMPFQRSFPFMPEKPGLYIIRGPRQIGKSSWLKTILSHHAKKYKCFYMSCENITDHKELAEILKSARDRKIVILDEISYVKDWDRAIKHEIDSGHSHILILTGSHSHDIKQGADRMPGRFENGGEFLLLPMEFDEFEAMRKQAGWKNKDRIQELEAYFKIGGFPTAIAEAGLQNKKPQKSMNTYLQWLSGDIAKLGKQESYFHEIMIQLALCLQNPISLQTLGKKTSIGSHNTVQDYISILESCFAVKTLYAVDPNSGSFRYRKDKKFYFTDPLIYWIALELSGQKIPENFSEKMAEQVAHEALTRRYKRVGYLQNKNGEIDFISAKQWAIEVKWSLGNFNLSKLYKNLTIPEKMVWTQTNFLKEWPNQK